ncbi:FMN-dependent NADH-azoreductase [Rheinheimera sp. 4Y26]|uniref:FMN-dependent NADH-azoreductase n=1 Tax=Rheinheimera sp. 4Y26 TaxID=2977811 RepID=UPI0021B0C23D|nr:NAD(P)H-dependent oxidoreductase [Rheinheimera sp. 4Y26]MCT6700827.1 NAD(P)H-dependent oxidoreductase [Rheinheimera sp. 4Y26]
MRNILVVNSSISGEKGQSSQLIHSFLSALPASAKVQELDLNQAGLTHLTMPEIAAWMTPENDRSADQQQLAAVSDGLIAQVKAADVILIGVPMYNFGVPSQLKAWFDRIARAGVTFKYTDKGPVGLLDDKPVVFFLTRGGLYKDLPQDTQTPYLVNFFNFIGLRNLHFIFAEGLNMGAEPAAAALEAARVAIAELRGNLAA